ncbi:MAG: nucleotide exchange factor GrpE, partial [Calditrichaeota bacterium]|nr:nucleotide exchange factor GrpE [Calditrichota bacterium]
DVIIEHDKALRLLAEYDNYRRRTQSEYRHIIQQASERLILNILPVVDDFNRFFEQDFAGTDPGKILDGVELIHRKLMDVLTTEGLKPIDSLGKEFSAELHEAVAQIEDIKKPDGVVIIEVEKGFQLGDKIIRHPKVVVNKKSECEIEAQDE